MGSSNLHCGYIVVRNTFSSEKMLCSTVTLFRFNSSNEIKIK